MLLDWVFGALPLRSLESEYRRALYFNAVFLYLTLSFAPSKYVTRNTVTAYLHDQHQELDDAVWNDMGGLMERSRLTSGIIRSARLGLYSNSFLLYVNSLANVLS